MDIVSCFYRFQNGKAYIPVTEQAKPTTTIKLDRGVYWAIGEVITPFVITVDNKINVISNTDFINIQESTNILSKKTIFDKIEEEIFVHKDFISEQMELTGFSISESAARLPIANFYFDDMYLFTADFDGIYYDNLRQSKIETSKNKYFQVKSVTTV